MSEPPEPFPHQGRAALGRARLRLALRTRELDALQALARGAAAARTPEKLVASVLGSLHRAVDLDLALVAHPWDGTPACVLYLSRPFELAFLEAVRQRVRGLLGWPSGAVIAEKPRDLDGFDAGRGERGGSAEEQVIVVPLVRRNHPAGYLLVVPALAPGKQGLRLLYSAANQLALHLDRILANRQAEADRFRAIVDAMPQGVLLTDNRLRPLQANPAAVRMLAACGFGGATALEPAFDRLGLTPLIERVREAGEAVAEGETHAAEDRIWSVTVSRLPGEAGELLVVLSDRTESRRLQQRLAQSEKMSSLGQMISGVAHELNNPLASIVGYAQLLGGTAGADGKLARRLQVLGREAERCRRIVQNLLSFARRREPERKPLSLNQVVENVVALLGYQLRVDGIRVEHELSPDLPALAGDSHELEQVLVNLLTNAAQAIRQSSPSGTITLRTRPEPGPRVVLEIEDTGPGIPDELRSKIFDPFFTTKAPGEGTGLGLALAYGIVTAHAGTIEALPHSRRGTTFRVTLPAGPGQRRSEAPAPPASRTTAAASGRVLVVDDDEAVAQLICDTLGRDGLSTRRARGGRQALSELKARSFDLIVCDVKMPDMSGERLYEELRHWRPELARRVLWTTGDTLSDVPERLAQRTGLDVLAKPFDLEELRFRVRRRLAEAAT